MSDYAEKLKDPRWQKKRLEVFNRDGFACLCCEDAKTTLHVHHLIYSKGEPWDAPMETLETLCEPCHEFREGFNNLSERSTTPTRLCYALVRFASVVYPKRAKNTEFKDAFLMFWKFVGGTRNGCYSKDQLAAISQAQAGERYLPEKSKQI